MEAFSAGHAAALAEAYDFSGHRRIMDPGGGTGSFLRAILERYVEGTLYELPQAAIARQKLKGTACERGITVLEGDFLKDPLPLDHDAFLVANVVHVLAPQQNQELFRRVRSSARRGARLLLLDLWTNAAPHGAPFCRADGGRVPGCGRQRRRLQHRGSSLVSGSDRVALRGAQAAWRVCEPGHRRRRRRLAPTRSNLIACRKAETSCALSCGFSN